MLLHSPLEIIAHRGASYEAPENTVAAFTLAWEQQADACELDIRLTKDGRIVAMHDGTARRTAGANRRVSALILEKLRTLDAGSWKGADWNGERIPMLEETFASVPEGKRLFIEIKCGPEVLPELQRVLDAAGKSIRPPVIIGFDLETMRQARARFPQLPICRISSRGNWKFGRSRAPEELIANAVAANLSGLALDRRFQIDEQFVSRAKDARLELYVWTVDDAQLARRLASLGVNGLITNRPLWLRKELEK